MEDTAAAPADIPTDTGQDQPTPEAPPTDGTSAGTGPNLEQAFEENFDPSTLPDELAPAYKQLQAAWTRKTQSLAEQRKEAENAQRFLEALQSEEHRPTALKNLAESLGGEEAILAALGYDVDDPELEDDPEFDLDDPAQAALARVQQLEAKLAERETAEQTKAREAAEQAEMDAIDAHISDSLKALDGYDQFGTSDGADPSPEEQAIVAIALAGLPAGDDGMPQIQAAAEMFEKAYESRFKRWSSTKDAPHVSPVGQAASQVPDLDNDNERQRWMLDRLTGGGL